MTTKDYNHCVNEYSDAIYTYLCRSYSNQEMAKDVVQSVFEKLWIKKDELDVKQVKSYLFTMARNRAIDVWRKEHRVVSIEAHHDRAQNSAMTESFENMEQAHHYLRSLDERQKSILLLREYEGHSYQDIADIMNMSLSQVKIILFRARKQLMQTNKKKSKAI